MSATPHLALPLLAAAQAQKHVTHNEALASLDALVHLAVKERGRLVPPESPGEGDRYLVGEGAGGVFATHDGEVAFFDLGLWRFLPPRPGWRLYVEAEERIVVFTGTAWRDMGHFSRDIDNLQRLGIGTQADDVNRLAAKLNAALLTALSPEEGGTGDLRVVLNKTHQAGTLSQLYQRGYSGRAETGLVGGDDFGIRVSPDGQLWRDALRIEAATGVVSFPSGISGIAGANLLINPCFLVNQRNFAGGSLLQSAYGFDRWKAGTGGCTLTRQTDGTVTLVGALDQIVDVAQAVSLTGRANLAGATMTLSVEDPSAPLPATIGSQSVTIPAGAGRRSASVVLGGAETGNILVRLNPTSACSFKRAKLEVGPVATPWRGDPIEVEELRCRRYYQRLAAGGPSSSTILGVLAVRISTNLIEFPLTLPVPMRAAPTIATNNPVWAPYSPGTNQIGFQEAATSAWVALNGGLSINFASPATPTACTVRFSAATSFSGAAGSVGAFHLGVNVHFGMQAEL